MKTMKYTINLSKSSLGRQGTISELPRIPDLTIETPSLMMYTKGGSIPHLTHEVLQMLTIDQFVMESPLQSTIHMIPGVKAHGKGLSHFCGLGEYPNLMMLQDPTAAIPHSPMELLKVPLWTRRGKIQLDADSYMNAVECFKPDIYSALCDSLTDSASSKKRLAKSLTRSTAMLTECIERHQKSQYLSQNSSLLGVIEGGYSVEDRINCVQSLLTVSDKLEGFVLGGINPNGPLIEECQQDQLEPFLHNIMILLPEDKLRVAPGCWNAVTLLYLISSGWDLFDTSIAYQTTERFHALSFHFQVDVKLDGSSDYEMNLQDKMYKEDFGPLVDGCTCLTCRKHTRAYIYHLINTKELLSSVLLMIHNLHHYIEYFKEIRRCIGSEKLRPLHDLIEEQYKRRVKPVLTKTPEQDTVKSRRLSIDSSPTAIDPKEQTLKKTV